MVVGLFVVSFGAFSSLGSVPNAYVSGSSVTVFTPLSIWCLGVGQSYDSTTSTCTVTGFVDMVSSSVEIASGETLAITTGNIQIESGSTLQIDSGGVVSISNTCPSGCSPFGAWISNNGNITNSGTINVQLSGACLAGSECFGIENDGNLTNYNTINLESTMTCNGIVCFALANPPTPGASFVNYGNLNVQDTFTCGAGVTCNGVSNDAPFFNECGATITIASTDTFFNQATLTNSGTITGLAYLTGNSPQQGATCALTSYAVSGTLTQTLCQNWGATWSVTYQTCTIPSTVEWNVSAYAELFINSPVINDGTINNALQGEIYISSTNIDNAGTINNYGLIQILYGAITGNAVNNIQNGLSGGYVFTEYFLPSGALTPSLCTANGATWDATTLTCTIPTTVEWVVTGLIGNSLTIQAGQTLVINPSVNDGVGLYSGLMSNAATITNYGTLIDQGFFINFHVIDVAGASPPVFVNYGSFNIASTGQFDNQGNLTNENTGTITNYGVISNVNSITNSGSVINEAGSAFYEFCGAILTGNSVTGITYLDGCQPTSQGSSTTTISGGGASTGPISNTGISATISGSLASGSSVTVNAAVLSSPESGVSVSGLGSPSYYDVKIFGITTGTAQICIASNPSSGLTMQYWDGSAWVNATSITTSTNPSQVCGDIPVSALTGTNVATGLGSTGPTSGVPEFPSLSALSLVLLTALLLPTLLLMGRRFRARYPL